jgi:predicted RNase H-like nuclease (RuvC/YqgF family)
MTHEITPNEYFKEARKEIDLALKTLEKSASTFDDLIEKQLNKFEQRLTELGEENFNLRKLPERVETSISQLVPGVSTQIQKSMFQECRSAIENCEKNINSLNDKLLLAVRKMEDIQTSEFKKKLKMVATAISISVFISGILTYCLIQSFPKIINVDTKGTINIEGGNVSVWGMGKSTVQASKKK